MRPFLGLLVQSAAYQPLLISVNSYNWPCRSPKALCVFRSVQSSCRHVCIVVVERCDDHDDYIGPPVDSKFHDIGRYWTWTR
ncbi:hypothetical protein BDR03DRAFT_949283 [Suillus americanus]|nr:hypothetical protein BDR03DRAFT_949283 [Suillus americanus]